MTSLTRLAELHVRQFMAQQKRQDELILQHQQAARRSASKARQDGDRWRQATINSAGPLCLLDAVGQAEESWVELFEQAPQCELPKSQDSRRWSPATLKPQWAYMP